MSEPDSLCPNMDKAGSPAISHESEDILLGREANGVTLVEALLTKYDESQFQTDLACFGARMSSKLKAKAAGT